MIYWPAGQSLDYHFHAKASRIRDDYSTKAVFAIRNGYWALTTEYARAAAHWARIADPELRHAAQDGPCGFEVI